MIDTWTEKYEDEGLTKKKLNKWNIEVLDRNEIKLITFLHEAYPVGSLQLYKGIDITQDKLDKIEQILNEQPTSDTVKSN